MFTKFNSCPYYSSRFSVCQWVYVELCELCRYAQNNRGDIVFYDRFVYLCKQKGISPTRAALDAGISKSLVTKWKTNNVKDPSPDVLRKLSKYFNITVAELMGEETEKTPTVSGEPEIDMSEIDIAFYGGYKELSEDDQKVIRDMVQLMRERRAKREGK